MEMEMEMENKRFLTDIKLCPNLTFGMEMDNFKQHKVIQIQF